MNEVPKMKGSVKALDRVGYVTKCSSCYEKVFMRIPYIFKVKYLDHYGLELNITCKDCQKVKPK